MPHEKLEQRIPYRKAGECDDRYSRLMTATSLLREPYRSQWHGIIYEQLEKLDMLLVDAIKQCGPGILLPDVQRKP